MRDDRCPRAGCRPSMLQLVLALLLALPWGVQAQQNGNGTAPRPTADGVEAPDSLELALARADSMRAQLVQPPGSYGGVRTMDVIRVPFQLFGATLTLGLAGVAAVYGVADEVLIEPALKVRDALAEVDVEASVGTLGNRSYPAVVLRYQGFAPFYAEAGYSLRQYQHFAAGYEAGDSTRGGRAAATYQRLRAPHFYGVGPDSRYEDRADYAHDLLEAAGLFWWAPADGPLTLSAGGGWERNEIGRGWDDHRTDLQDRPFAGTLVGLEEPTEFVRLQAGADLDRTFVEHLQTRGARLLGELVHYQGVGGTPSSFLQAAADARLFFPVNPRQLVAMRVMAEETLGEGEDGVPFTHLARLGDDDGLRGHTSRRFRDRALLAGQLEWRYEAYWHPGFSDRRVEGFAFLDAGMVAPSLADMALSEFRATPGLGIRWIEGGRSRVEGYVAFGGGRARLDLELGRTF